MEEFKYVPLESDPEIFNEYFHTLGLPPNFSFQELFSFDYKEIQGEIDGNINILGVVVNQLKLVNRQDIYIAENFDDPNSVKFYMEQDDRLYNACGVVAGVHAIGNIPNDDKGKLPLTENSILDGFLNGKERKTPKEYCDDMFGNSEWKEVHKSIAKRGSTVFSETVTVKHHYVTFVKQNDMIYELDGRLSYPYCFKDCATATGVFLDDVISILKERLEKNLIDPALSMLLLVQTS